MIRNRQIFRDGVLIEEVPEEISDVQIRRDAAEDRLRRTRSNLKMARTFAENLANGSGSLTTQQTRQLGAVLLLSIQTFLDLELIIGTQADDGTE